MLLNILCDALEKSRGLNSCSFKFDSMLIIVEAGCWVIEVHYAGLLLKVLDVFIKK